MVSVCDCVKRHDRGAVFAILATETDREITITELGAVEAIPIGQTPTNASLQVLGDPIGLAITVQVNNEVGVCCCRHSIRTLHWPEA